VLLLNKMLVDLLELAQQLAAALLVFGMTNEFVVRSDPTKSARLVQLDRNKNILLERIEPALGRRPLLRLLDCCLDRFVRRLRSTIHRSPPFLNRTRQIGQQRDENRRTRFKFVVWRVSQIQNLRRVFETCVRQSLRP